MCSDFDLKLCQRPYHVEHTSSRPITEVKQHWARIVLGWETAWELRVLLAFFFKSGYVVGGKMTCMRRRFAGVAGVTGMGGCPKLRYSGLVRLG